jgi:hypothetical protein
VADRVRLVQELFVARGNGGPGTKCGTPRKWPSRKSNAILTHVAADERLSASTKNRAISALLFRRRHAIRRDLDRDAHVLRAPAAATWAR